MTLPVPQIVKDVFRHPFPLCNNTILRLKRYVRVPLDSQIWPIFYTIGFSPTQLTVNCDVPCLSDCDWFIVPESAFLPIDLMFDSKFKQWNGVTLSTMIDLSMLIMAILPAPIEHQFSGRVFVGFLAKLDDLTI